MNLNTQLFFKLICSLLIGVSIAGNCVYGGIPAFVSESIYSPNKARIKTIDSNLVADLVILDGGLEQGFRLGMLCSVERRTYPIGELIIIKSESNCSAALILNLEDNFTIQSFYLS